ncbi:amphi-Trp domain-containing protein [Savagea sp. SN6]|uniref:Amphi-Trp domain-containing protein n=1 Tax=Savagea serpentis TaxID=2785297 RepID=A0A8J7GA21_9BACL|nr:amphi-Trp domain-containing protein [Savagea serpentis]MBF4502038.1 amphi-Trp domain-containing protein [Savagea serpentis]
MARKRVPKEVLLDFERKMSLTEAATFLETIAAKLKEEGQMNLVLGEQEVELTPTERVEFEIKVERRGTKYEFEIELEWDESRPAQHLKIE